MPRNCSACNTAVPFLKKNCPSCGKIVARPNYSKKKLAISSSAIVLPALFALACLGYYIFPIAGSILELIFWLYTLKDCDWDTKVSPSFIFIALFVGALIVAAILLLNSSV